MEDLWRDLRYALRSLGRTKLVTLVATLSLALAIAGNATVFSLISSLFLRPLPYEEPERIILVGERPRDLPDGAGITGASVANFLDWRERQTCFEHLAAFQPRPAGLASGEAEPEAVLIGTATTGFFELLGVQPARGRLFTAEDSGTGALRIALVTHGFWTERLGRAWGDSAVVTIDQQDYRVVGILPADFEFLGARKLAKALKRRPMVVAETIVSHLDLAGLDADVRILPDSSVCVDLGGRTEPDGPPPVS